MIERDIMGTECLLWETEICRLILVQHDILMAMSHAN